jgi:hypothetical protein
VIEITNEDKKEYQEQQELFPTADIMNENKAELFDIENGRNG